MRLAAICLAGFALVVSVLGLGSEMGTYLRAQQGANSFYTSGDPGLSSPPRSVEGQYAALLTCDRALLTGGRRFMPPERRELVASQCLALADSVLAQAPSLSVAHLVRALAANELGNSPIALEALLAAEATGGDLTWMTERRFIATLPHLEALSPDQQARFARDIQRLAQSWTGVRMLARQYDRRPELRDTIITTVDTLPEDIQRRFLSAVRRASS